MIKRGGGSSVIGKTADIERRTRTSPGEECPGYMGSEIDASAKVVALGFCERRIGKVRDRENGDGEIGRRTGTSVCRWKDMIDDGFDGST